MEQLEEKIQDTLGITDKYFILSEDIPLISDKLTVAEIVFKSTDYYLDLLKDILDNEREDLVSKYGIYLLIHREALFSCINCLLSNNDMKVPKELDSKYTAIFSRFMNLIRRVEYEDMLKDESGLWHTYKPKQ